MCSKSLLQHADFVFLTLWISCGFAAGKAIVRRASTKQYHGANFIRQWLVAEFLRHFSDAFDCGGFDVAGSLIAVLTI
jgi:hypothetical protein